MTTHDPVRFWARVQPDRVALRGPRATWTYRALDKAVWSTADALLERGLGSGEHLSLEFEASDSVAFAVAFHALQRIGLLPVLIDPKATDGERRILRERAQVDFALTAGDLPIDDVPPSDTPVKRPSRADRRAARARRAADESNGAGDGAESESTFLGGPLPAAAAEEPDDESSIERRLAAPAAVCFTSGTSGGPRAAVLTHGNFLWSALASARNLGVRADDLWLACLPLHHVGGLSILTRSAAYGTAALLHERFDADAVSRAIDEDGVTLLSLVPTMLARLLDARQGRGFPARLRAALIGGGPIAPELLEAAAALGLRALPTYGLTEATSQVTTLPLREWPRGLASAGRPLPFLRVEIHDAEDRPVGRGGDGEIVVRGPTVMAGYLGDPDANQAVLSKRWLRTGDAGTWDSDGRLIVLDRRADRIVTGGENVSPEEVERALERHPAVAEACVVAIPSREWGQEVAAVVALRAGRSLELESLREFLAGGLSGFKVPRHLVVLPALPRTGSGKLLRRVIRERLLDEMAKQKHP